MSASRILRSPAAGALLLAVCLTASGCSSDDGKDAASPPSSTPTRSTSAAPAGEDSTAALPAALTGQRIDWSECAAPTPLQGSGEAPQPLDDGSEWECGVMKAPLDYADPGGDTIDIALIRVEAASADERIGSLVFNFGGPGGSGVATLPAFAPSEYEDLHQRYDLVSFDPRGVGESEGVRCLDDAGLDRQLGVDATPDTAEERTSYVQDLEDFADACERRSGAVLPHVDTRSAARDMDLMRAVLGDDRLNYFGVSYGTELGGVYAHLFPGRVGRTVLDAVVDPTEDTAEGALGQAEGFELALGNFISACTDSGGCPVDGAEDVAALLRGLDRTPLPTGEDRVLTEAYGTTGVIAALYSQDTWPYLKTALDDALDGDGSMLLAFADSYASRDDEGRYANILPANAAINCADTSDRYTAQDVRSRLPRFREAAPTFGDSLAWGMLQCTGWPVKGDAETVDVDAEGAGPIVVIGNTGDPATPYEGAARMAEGLGEGVGIQLTVKGEGHGTYAVSDCVTDAVDAYLLDGEVPENGTTCEE